MFSTGIMFIPKGPPADVVAAAQLAEACGYDFCLIADEGFTYDVYVMMALIVGQTSRLRVAPITNPYSRHPAVTAAAVASVNALAPGRAFLSVVAGGSLVLGPMQLTAEKPAVACGEMIEIVRRLGKGDKVDFTGRQFHLSGAQLAFPAASPDIWVMARGPKMMRMAAVQADVVVIQSKLGLEGALEEVRQSAAASGHCPGLAYLGNLAFKQAVMDRMRPHYTYAIPDSPPSTWQALGLSAEWVAALKRRREAEGQEAAAQLISDDVLRQCMVAGTPEECAHEVQRLANERGFRHFILPVMSLDRGYALPVIEEAAQVYARAKELADARTIGPVQ